MMFSMLAAAKAILVDLDGCFLAGTTLAPGAAELFARFGDRIAFVSNNSSHTPGQMAAELALCGVPVASARIFLAGAQAVSWLATHRSHRRILALTSRSIRNLARQHGLALTFESPEVLLLGRDVELTYERLAMAVAALHRGAELVVTNPDLVHPGADGVPVPETGTLLAGLMASMPLSQPVIVGKPQPTLFAAALRALDAEPSQAVMIGDNPATDGVGATALGIPFILVGSHREALVPGLDHLLHRRAA